MNVKVFSRLVAVLCSAGALASVDCDTAISAQRRDNGQAEVPDDTCILEVIAPEDVTITIDGHDFGTKREFTFDELEPGYTYASTLSARFADGSSSERDLLIRAGWHARLSLQSSDTSCPQLLAQTSRFWDKAYALSPDHRYLAIASNTGTTSLWDVGTGRYLRTYEAPRGRQPQKLTFTPDGQQLVTASNYRVKRMVSGEVWWDFPTEITFWDVATGVLLRSHRIDLEYVKDIRFAPDGEHFVVCFREIGKNSTTVIWDTSTGRPRKTIDHGEQKAEGLAFHPDGRCFAVGLDQYSRSGSGSVLICDVKTGEIIRTLDLDKRRFEGLAISPNGRYLVTGEGRGAKRKSIGTVTLWEWETGRKVWSIPVDHAPDIAYLPDGRILDTGRKQADSELLEATILDTETGAEVHSFALEQKGCQFMAGLPGTSHLLVNDHVYDIKDGRLLRTISGASEPIGSVQLSADGRMMLANKSVWDLERGSRLHTFQGNSGLGQMVCLSPDGRLVATSVEEEGKYSVVLWNAETGRQVLTYDSHAREIVTIAFDATGRRLVTGHNDQTATVWDVDSEDMLFTVKHKTRRVDNDVDYVELSPDNRWLLTAVHNSFHMYIPHLANLTVWNSKTGSRLRSLEDLDERLSGFRSLALVPNSNFVIGCKYNELLLFDIDGNIERTFSVDSPESDGAISVSCSPKGSYVLANLLGGRVMIWETSTGRLLRTFHGHRAYWHYADGAFTSNEQYVMTGAADGTVRLWDLATGEELARLVNVNDRGDWLVTTPEGLFDGSPVGRQGVAYRIGSGLNVVPVDRLFQDFYYPGLLAAIWRGERPMPTTKFADKLAPAIQIVSPEQSGTVDSAQLELQVEVTDRGGGVKGPWLLQNGARVLSPGRPVAKGKIIERSFEVALVEGENRLEVCAASEDGSWESEPAVITFTYQESLPEPQLHLLVVGVNRYAQGTMNLKFAVSDAKAMAGLFQERGPALYGANRVHVKELLDAEATADGIEKAIAEIADKARSQDTLVVFLAGHGTTVGQRYYFIPHDFESEADELEDDIRTQGLPGDVLGDWIGAVPALKRVVIFDTCQSGGTIRISRTARSPFAFRGALERLSRSQGIFTLAATSATDEAQEVPDLGHGVLTYALLAAMGAVDQGPLRTQPLKRSEEHVVQVRDWFSFAQDKVPRLTSLYFGEEQFVGFSGSGSDFPILPYE